MKYFGIFELGSIQKPINLFLYVFTLLYLVSHIPLFIKITDNTDHSSYGQLVVVLTFAYIGIFPVLILSSICPMYCIKHKDSLNKESRTIGFFIPLFLLGAYCVISTILIGIWMGFS